MCGAASISFRSIVEDSSSVNLVLIKLLDVIGRPISLEETAWSFSKEWGGDRERRSCCRVTVRQSRTTSFKWAMMIFNGTLKTRNWCSNILIWFPDRFWNIWDQLLSDKFDFDWIESVTRIFFDDSAQSWVGSSTTFNRENQKELFTSNNQDRRLQQQTEPRHDLCKSKQPLISLTIKLEFRERKRYAKRQKSNYRMQ